MLSRPFHLIRLLLGLLLLLQVVGVVSCKTEVPEGILSDADMEDVLYDYQLAQQLGNSSAATAVTGNRDWRYNEHYFMKSALAKHGLTEADFDRSLEWYTRHAERLFAIYKRLDDRLTAETGSGASGAALAVGTTGTDTVDVWKGPRHILLSSTGPTNYNFELAADTSYHAGDRLTLNFRTAWIYREGDKTAIAMLCLVYAGDSVDARTVTVYTAGDQNVSITVGTRPLKAVRGFIYQQTQWSDKPKLLLLSDINLLKMHTAGAASTPLPAGAENGNGDTRPGQTPEQRLRDSLLRNDSLQKVAPHFREGH